MYYLLFLGISLALFVGFFALTMAEARTGMRLLNVQRRALDKRVGKMFFIVGHVDWSAFIGHMVQSFFARLAHDIAHWTLIVVRFVERQLSTIVRTLRNQRPNVLAPKPSRSSPVEQTLDYVRGMLPGRSPRKRMRDE